MGGYDVDGCVRLAAAICHRAIKDWRPLRRYFLHKGVYTHSAYELITFFNSELFDGLLGNVANAALVREKLKIPNLKM